MGMKLELTVVVAVLHVVVSIVVIMYIDIFITTYYMGLKLFFFLMSMLFIF